MTLMSTFGNMLFPSLMNMLIFKMILHNFVKILGLWIVSVWDGPCVLMLIFSVSPWINFGMKRMG